MHDAFPQGCNISVTLSDGAFPIAQEVSPRRASFLGNLIGRSSKKEVQEKEGDKSPSWSLFSKKQTTPCIVEQSQEDKATAELISQLQMEGRSEAEINMHLSYIHDMRTPCVVTPVSPPQLKESTNVFSRFLRDVQTVFKENFSMEDVIVPYHDTEFFEDDLQRLTVGISTAPFYGALPPDVDLSYEELAALEPVYVGSKSINNLPSCVHDGSPLPGDQTKCPVCMDDFAEGNTLKSLPCVHFYHQDCIDSWLLVGHTCPVCKLLVE